MNSVFKSDKIPYFLTLIFAIVALQFNYILDNIFKIPIIEYEFQDGENKEDTLFEKFLLLKNISSDKMINDFHIQLKFQSSSASIITYPDIDPIPPATIIQNPPKSTQNKLVYFPIQIIQPGLSYRLKYFTNENQVNPTISFECNEPIKLVEKSIYTFLLSNQNILNLIIMLFFIFLSIIYIIKISK